MSMANSGRLPLARRIYNGEEPLLLTAGPQGMSKLLERSAFFDIQVADDLISSDAERQGGEAVYTDFGPMRPPYPHMWLEWRGQEARGGCIEIACYTGEKGVTSGGQYVYGLLLLMSYEGEPIQCLPEQVYLIVDADGFQYGGEVVRDVRDESELAYPQELRNEILRVKMALSLINCRNVKTAEAGTVTNVGRSGAQKRRGEKAFTIRYNTILLPGGGSEYDAKSGTHRATALHRVRGHFKTFTAERPLLGRAVGTYWWGWQLRGDPKRGIVISDYQIDDQNG